MRVLVVILCVVLLVGCATPRDDGLYRELGGLTGIERIVDLLMEGLTTDPRVAEFFIEENMQASLARVHEKLVEQICMESGGPCEYTGDPMDVVHRGLDINDAEFNALVEILIDAMRQTGVPARARARLIARLAPMHGEIVQSPEAGSKSR